ncbi:trypsin-like serine peptidase [Streptomyces sp. NPDC050161]|uniref:trypsin-like serine peptidase n=1 Tax=Streptomyces sp. NPDC050161 TaxID=3365604 RepID=UPI0037AF9AA3
MTRRRMRVAAAALGTGLGLCLATASLSQAGAAPGDAAPSPGATAVTPSHSGTPSHPGAPKTSPRILAASADPTWNTTEAADFWTPRKMAAAVPGGSVTPRSAPHRDASPDASVKETSTGKPVADAATQGPGPAAGAAPNARHIDGIPSVGVLFSVDKDSRAHYCTASVVRSPHRNLILTAGHCNPGSNAAFVPQYRSGAAKQPYGVWAITGSFTYPGHGTTGDGSDLDFAFATVAPDRRGRRIEAVTGGNTLSPTPGYTNDVSVIGYPSVRNDPEDRAVRCETRTTRLTGHRQLRMECGGFYGGTSGSPWLTHFDEDTRTGRIIGNIGGLNGGGPSGPHADRTSYSPYYGIELLTLYTRATMA